MTDDEGRVLRGKGEKKETQLAARRVFGVFFVYEFFCYMNTVESAASFRVHEHGFSLFPFFSDCWRGAEMGRGCYSVRARVEEELV